jgi:hypothetical protein
LQIQSTNSAIIKLREQANQLYSTQQKRLNEKYKKQLEEMAMARALKKRNIQILDECLFDSMRQYENTTHYAQKEDRLHFSVLLLYDEYKQSDFIQVGQPHIKMYMYFYFVLIFASFFFLLPFRRIGEKISHCNKS